MMNWIWQDEWAVIRSTIPEWESYIFSKEIFWPLHFGKDFVYRGAVKPRLSAGRLLISLYLLEYFQKNDDEIENTVRKDFLVINDLKNQWKSNWTKKLLAEIPNRLRQWGDTIQLLRRNALHNSEYQNQVQIRLMLDLMISDIPKNSSDQTKNQIILLDQQLKIFSQASPFVWNEDISFAFDQDKYWYLFSKIKS